MRVVDVARVCHEANRGYAYSIGDFSHNDWNNAPEWQRESAVAGVKHILANPALTAEETHAAWYAMKKEQGWVYGPIKDAVKKEHPCMLPFDSLPMQEQAKDKLFVAIVGALAPYVVVEKKEA